MPKGQDFFSPFELLFMAWLLANLVTLGFAGWHVAMATRHATMPLARRARLGRALAVLRALAIADAAYLAAVFVTSLRPPAPIPAPHIGDPLCLAHRCIAVADVTRTHHGADVTYDLSLRLTNSSRFPMRDQLVGVYLVDDKGRKYPPSAGALDRSLTAELEPGATVTARRIFTVPMEAGRAGFGVERASGPRLRCLIIGGPCWFPPPVQPPVVLDP